MEKHFADDVLYRIFNHGKNISPLLMENIVAIMAPVLVEINGCLLVADVDGCTKFDDRKAQGLPPKEAQYWANLLDLTEVFQIEFEIAIRFGRSMVTLWDSAINAIGASEKHVAKLIRDDDLGEVYITIAHR